VTTRTLNGEKEREALLTVIDALTRSAVAGRVVKAYDAGKLTFAQAVADVMALDHPAALPWLRKLLRGGAAEEETGVFFLDMNLSRR
jgi:hypothetical protein